MSGSMIEVMGVTPRMGRRSMALADIDPKYVSQSGIWEASEMETSRGSIRIQHLTATSAAVRPLSSGTASSSGLPTSSPRFPKLEECAHFHYDSVDLPLLKILIRDDASKSVVGLCGDEAADRCAFSIEVVSGGQSWAIQRTHANLFMLDEQLHRCVWDRSFSLLEKVEKSVEDHEGCKALGERYLVRLTELPTNKITCGTVLSWLELDNRGRHIVSSDDSAINTPAVAAACAVRKYTSQAADEISFEVGDMISVIDMPPPEESVWWRGKRGFHVGFFPREHVQVIGDKVPVGLPIVSSTRRLQRLSVSSNSSAAPAKPVLRKHGKLIAFFRSFILSRPSRRRLKQSGILRERVFSCDLAEHLLNTGNEIPAVLKCCSEFIEMYGIVDGIYRLSGVTSNIQKLRNSFDEDKVPNLAEDEAIKQDIHAVSSLLKMYFRELPNPLCTYQLYEKFVGAAQASDQQRLFKMREVVHELPPPHYRTLEYLMKHLARVAKKSNDTGMTPKNMAIVWAPNLIRCKELEAGGVAALKGIGVQAVVTEYLVRHADLIFNEKLPENFPSTTTLLTHKAQGRPKSLAISSPIRLMSLEEAQDKAKDERKYIEVGGGPSSLPPKYHTVIDLPSRRSALKNKRSPIGWRHFFSRNRSFSKPVRKAPTPCEITVVTKNVPLSMQGGSGTNWAGRLRPVKSVESLVSSPLYQGASSNSSSSATSNGHKELDKESVAEELEGQLSRSSPATPVADVHVLFHPPPPECVDVRGGGLNPKTHNRSISHDSYFEFGEFRNGNNVYIDETLEEETLSHSSKLSLDVSSGVESTSTSPKKQPAAAPASAAAIHHYSSSSSYNGGGGRSPESPSTCFRSPVTPPPSAASLQPPEMSESITSVTSMSSDDYAIHDLDERLLSRSPLLSARQRPSKWMESDLVLALPASPAASPPAHSTPPYDLRECVPGGREGRRSAHSHASSSDNKYELDRNSSVDESSADSTPGELFATTNIVYSPLVNEVPSPAPLHQTHHAPANIQLHSASLFICPLYEAGINADDLGTEPDSPPSITVHVQLDLIPPPKDSSPRPHYENCQSRNECSKEEEGHVYENNRLYQNEILRPGKEEGGQEADGAETPPTQHPAPAELDHYEHVESRQESDPSDNDYEGNIYEDIDDDEDNVHAERNSYETVTVCSPSPSPPRPPPLTPNTCSNDLLLKTSPENSDTETEAAYESVQFHDVGLEHHYAEIHEHPPSAEAGDRRRESLNSAVATLKTESVAATPNSEEESSPSHSHTEDVVTYLDTQGPSLKLRQDSLEDESQIKEDAPPPPHPHTLNRGVTESGSSSSRQTSEEEEEEEIRHIDSPGLVDNPLYGLQLQQDEGVEKAAGAEEEDDNDFSINDSLSIEFDASVSESKSGEASTNNPPAPPPLKSDKLLGRCNSAPLSETMCEFAVARKGGMEGLNGGDGGEKSAQDEEGGEAGRQEPSRLLLCKRLSEPSLLMSKGRRGEEKAGSSAAWKVADAKRLANRKQSVKELLSRFESQEGGKTSPAGGASASSPVPAAHGLPRAESREGGSLARAIGGSARFQHHRFSMGDILMSQSLSGCDDMSPIKSSTLLIRSDTFPELRTEASKENRTSPLSETGTHSLSDSGHPLVADKVQQALRVAMSSVDMNDPSTRERIEKYKEERRTFLRQKINSEITGDAKSGGATEGKGSLTSLKSPDALSLSSTESVFGSSAKLLPPSASIRCTDSPRKRAFSEDIPPLHANQTKTIKTESLKGVATSHNVTSSSETISSGAESMEEVNVREKVALWSVHKAAMAHSASASFPDTLKRDEAVAKPSKAPLKEASSLPPEGFTKPALRREMTTSAIDMGGNKLKNAAGTLPAARATESGKKIKDMAAFFERKQF